MKNSEAQARLRSIAMTQGPATAVAAIRADSIANGTGAISMAQIEREVTAEPARRSRATNGPEVRH